MTSGPDVELFFPVAVDAHCHVDLYQDPQQIVADADRHRIAVIAVTNTPSVFAKMQELASGSTYVLPALGLHPELASDRRAEMSLLPTLLDRTRFVGEIGLNHFA